MSCTPLDPSPRAAGYSAPVCQSCIWDLEGRMVKRHRYGKQRYGIPKAGVLGQVTYTLLKTSFPCPLLAFSFRQTPPALSALHSRRSASPHRTPDG
jgi:hypothetical protein